MRDLLLIESSIILISVFGHSLKLVQGYRLLVDRPLLVCVDIRFAFSHINITSNEDVRLAFF